MNRTPGLAGRSTAQRAHVAVTAERLVLYLLLLNIAVDLGCRLAGIVTSMQSVVPLEDSFSDYFRFVTSYPGGESVSSHFGALTAKLQSYQRMNPPAGVAALRSGMLTHFHAPPLVALFGLLNVRAMQWVEPALVLAAIYAALLAYWYAIFATIAHSRAERWAWLLLGIISYPMLMVVVRGNVYAGLTALLIIHAVVLAMQGRSPRLAAILLAVAIGMRPNAIIFALPLIMLHPQRWRALLTLMIAGPAISGGAMLAAHLLYPDYTITTFLAGLRVYYVNHVVHHYGIAFGSSLFGALTVVGAPRAGLTTLAMIPAAAIGLAALALWVRGRVNVAAFLFLICAAYCLGSTVFADYHLFVFVLPIMAMAKDADRKPNDSIVLVASSLMLAPKNYLFNHDISVSTVLNPLILLTASAAIIVLALRDVRWHRAALQPA